MAADSALVAAPARSHAARPGGLALGLATGYLSVVVLLPLAALVWASRAQGPAEFWHQATAPESVAALKLTLGLAAACAFARRRRLGPYRRDGRGDRDREKELGAFARAGFSRAIAQAVLACVDPGEAEALARGESE